MTHVIYNSSDNSVAENSKEYVNVIKETLSSDIRNQRDSLLKSSDWVVTMSIETHSTIPTEWTLYRQALRDITGQDEFPYNIEWPSKPGED